MENTIENARKFFDPNEGVSNAPQWSEAVIDFVTKKRVAYAASLQSEIVLPSYPFESYINSGQDERGGFIPNDRLDIMKVELKAWNACLSEIKRLNNSKDKKTLIENVQELKSGGIGNDFESNEDILDYLNGSDD